jgi:hypothetical protein
MRFSIPALVRQLVPLLPSLSDSATQNAASTRSTLHVSTTPVIEAFITAQNFRIAHLPFTVRQHRFRRAQSKCIAGRPPVTSQNLAFVTPSLLDLPLLLMAHLTTDQCSISSSVTPSFFAISGEGQGAPQFLEGREICRDMPYTIRLSLFAKPLFSCVLKSGRGRSLAG